MGRRAAQLARAGGAHRVRGQAAPAGCAGGGAARRAELAGSAEDRGSTVTIAEIWSANCTLVVRLLLKS